MSQPLDLKLEAKLYSRLGKSTRRIMLRSRTKTGDTPRHPYGSPDLDVENQVSHGYSRFQRIGALRMRMCSLAIFFLMIISLDRLRRWRVLEVNSFGVMSPPVEGKDWNAAQGESDLMKTWNSTWRYPLVDRIALHHLDQLQDSLMDAISFNANYSSDDQVQRRPRVIHLPEDTSRSRSAGVTKLANEGICETTLSLHLSYPHSQTRVEGPHSFLATGTAGNAAE
jgi:hypothetical protein